jgi:hypothetical protein
MDRAVLERQWTGIVHRTREGARDDNSLNRALGTLNDDWGRETVQATTPVTSRGEPMSRTRACWLIAPAAALLTAVAAAPAWAVPVIDPAPIGPNQYFHGLVNDHSGQASILMGCLARSDPARLATR